MLPKIYTIMFWFSMTLILASVVLLFLYGLNFGVDFKGGSVLEVGFKAQRPDISAVQSAVNLPDVLISPSGDDGLLIRTKEMSEPEHQALLNNLTLSFPDSGAEERRFDSVGPVIGNELKNKSIKAIVLVLLAITIYISIVFRRLAGIIPLWAMGAAAIIALAHDILIPMGIFAFLGYYFDVQINAVFVAAVLTILGYSVADTVVVFDRVRENIVLKGMGDNFSFAVHRSVLQTLTRSLNTTFTTLLSLAAIYLFGGESIRYFALALILGIFFGAYSSIFVASPVLVWISGRKSGR